MSWAVIKKLSWLMTKLYIKTAMKEYFTILSSLPLKSLMIYYIANIPSQVALVTTSQPQTTPINT
jgi:hypothetical protein